MNSSYSSYSIYTYHVLPEYKDFINTIVATTIIFITLHLLMSGQKNIGLIGNLFNSPFSETFSKVLISLAFYFLVFRKIISIV